MLVPINFRLNEAEVALHRRALGRDRACSSIPSSPTRFADVPAKRTFVIGDASDAELHRFGVEPEAWAPDEDATATINYTSGTTARPKGVQLTHRNLWLNAATFGWQMGVNDRDVYLHTLPMFHCNGWGMTYAVTGMGGRHVVLRKVDGAEILRRVDAHGVTLMCGAPAVVAAVLDAAAAWDGPIPGAGRVRIVVAGAPPPTRTIERVETELGWEFVQIYGLTETSPLLTMNRGRAEYDDLSTGRAGTQARPRRRTGARRAAARSTSTARCSRAATSCSRATGSSPRPPPTRSSTAGSTPATAAPSTTRATSRSPTARRTSSSAAARTCRRSRSRTRLFSHPEVAEAAVIGVPTRSGARR